MYVNFLAPAALLSLWPVLTTKGPYEAMSILMGSNSSGNILTGDKIMSLDASNWAFPLGKAL